MAGKEICEHDSLRRSCLDCYEKALFKAQQLIAKQDREIEKRKKYIGFLQSACRSGESWDGTMDDFIKRAEEVNP